MEAWGKRIYQRQLVACQSLMLAPLYTHVYSECVNTHILHRCWEVAALLVTTVSSSLTSGYRPKTNFCPVECGISDACYFQAWLSHPSLSPTGCQCKFKSHLLWMAEPQSAWVSIYLCKSVPHPHPHQCQLDFLWAKQPTFVKSLRFQHLPLQQLAPS